MIIRDDMSPGMRQYLNIKDKYNDCIILNRMGDFYEMFFEDALTASKELDLILTSKKCGTNQKAPMCGVPYHSVDNYISKLVANGHKVAIVEQLTQPTPGKNTMLERDVVRVITPGTIIEQDMLDQKKNNYLLSVYKHGEKLGASYVDISTGEFYAINLSSKPEQELSDLIARINPSEIIGNEEAFGFYNSLPILRLGDYKKLSKYYDWAYQKKSADDILIEQFGMNYNVVFDVKGQEVLICSAGALLVYIKETQKRVLCNISKIKVVNNKDFMTIDSSSRRNLELIESNRDKRKDGTIYSIINKTQTPMGARTLRRMLEEPLQNASKINERLDGVEELTKKIIVREKLTRLLHDINDLERMTSKIAYGSILPKELYAVGEWLKLVPEIKEVLAGSTSKIIKEINSDLVDVSDVTSLIERAIEKEPGRLLKDGGYIKDGFNSELDEYRRAKDEGKNWIEALENKEAQATGIKNLKIVYNRVFGYFIEVNNSQLDKVPLRYIRKQTISNGERYITEDLKILEEKVLGAEEKAIMLEGEIYAGLKKIMLKYIQTFQQIGSAIGQLDALLSLSLVAIKNDYCRPTISSKTHELKIIGGRHPVVEQFIPKGQFVENDALLDENENKIMIITGPNMAGKSTYMRQVAIITLLAHVGSFVPAKEAVVPLTDRIFTRVGASDDLALGQSTFMVEMSEVANILANATNKSLIILDEIGRGTSTFDGLSIAWSVVEYLASKCNAKTLFATHYHELTELEGVIDGVKNYKISVKEVDDSIVFLRKIVRGGANKSFGVEVAKLAGVPDEVIDRAKEISYNLEAVNQKLDLNLFKEKKKVAEENTKLALSILAILKDIEIEKISPMHAFDILNDLVKQAKIKE